MTIAMTMGGALAEAVRAAVAAERARREAAEAECARLRVDLEATERARQAAEDERDDVLELVADDVVRAARARDDRDAARLAAALTALADERARCAAVCREVACFYHQEDIGSVVALACADEIEREPLDIQRIAE